MLFIREVPAILYWGVSCGSGREYKAKGNW